jgi:uncharacterized protein YuzE
VEVRVTYDGSTDTAYIYLVPIASAEVAATVVGDDESGAVNLDFDGEGRLLGIEVTCASRCLPGAVIDAAERLD